MDSKSALISTVLSGLATNVVGLSIYYFSKKCCGDKEEKDHDFIGVEMGKQGDQQEQDVEEEFEEPDVKEWQYTFGLCPENTNIREHISWASFGTLVEFVITLFLGQAAGALPSILSIPFISDDQLGVKRMEAYFVLKELGLETYMNALQVFSGSLVLVVWMNQCGSLFGFLGAAIVAALCTFPHFSLAGAFDLTTDQTQTTKAVLSALDELAVHHLWVLICLLAALAIHSGHFLYQRAAESKEKKSCGVWTSFILVFITSVWGAFMFGSHTFCVHYMAESGIKSKAVETNIYVATFKSHVDLMNGFGIFGMLAGLLVLVIVSAIYKRWRWLIMNTSVLVSTVVLTLHGISATATEALRGCALDGVCTIKGSNQTLKAVTDGVDFYDSVHPIFMTHWLLLFVVISLNLVFFQNFMQHVKALNRFMLTYEGALLVWAVTAIGVALFNEFDYNKFTTLKSTNQVIHLLGDMLVVAFHTGLIPNTIDRVHFACGTYALGFFFILALMIPGAEGDLTWQKFLLGHFGDTALGVVELTILFRTMTMSGPADSALQNMMGRAIHGVSLFAGRFFLWNTVCGYWALWFGLGTLYGGLAVVGTVFWTNKQRKAFAIRTRVETAKNWPQYLVLLIMITVLASYQEYSFGDFIEACVSTRLATCFCFTDVKLTYTNVNIAPASTLTNVVWMVIISIFIVGTAFMWSIGMFKEQEMQEHSAESEQEPFLKKQDPSFVETPEITVQSS